MANLGSATVGISPGDSHSWTGLSDVVRAVHSQEIRLKVQPVLRHAQFAQHRTELGTQPGNQITMLNFGNLPRGGRLSEAQHIETKALSSSTDQITVYEYGNGVAATEYLLRSSFVDLMGIVTLLLANDAALVYDDEFRKEVYYGLNTIFGNDATDRASIGATDYANVGDLRDAVEILATKKSPKFSGLGRDAYIMLTHPHVIRKFKDDTKWEDPAKYAGSRQLFHGEMGRIDDVIMIETTMAPWIAHTTGNVMVDGEDTGENDTPGSGTVDIYKSVILGADAYGFAEGLPIELRDDGVVDFGRERKLAWYGISGYSRLDEDRIVRIESA